MVTMRGVMKFRTIAPYVLVAAFAVLAALRGTDHRANAALAATQQATPVPTTPAEATEAATFPPTPEPGSLQGITIVETEAAEVTPTPVPMDASQIHILYQTADKTCDVSIADLVGQNASCIAQNLVSDTLSAAQTAYGISATDKTVLAQTSMDAALSADASKAIVVPHVTLTRAKAVVASVYRIYLIDVAAVSSKLLVDRTDKGATPAPGGTAALTPDGKSVAYTDQGLIFVQALDGIRARQLS